METSQKLHQLFYIHSLSENLCSYCHCGLYFRVFFLFYFFYLYFRVLTEKPVLYIRNQKQITLLYVIVFFKKSAYMNTFKKNVWPGNIFTN